MVKQILWLCFYLTCAINLILHKSQLLRSFADKILSRLNCSHLAFLFILISRFLFIDFLFCFCLTNFYFTRWKFKTNFLLLHSFCRTWFVCVCSATLIFPSLLSCARSLFLSQNNNIHNFISMIKTKWQIKITNLKKKQTNKQKMWICFLKIENIELKIIFVIRLASTSERDKTPHKTTVHYGKVYVSFSNGCCLNRALYYLFLLSGP